LFSVGGIQSSVATPVEAFGGLPVELPVEEPLVELPEPEPLVELPADPPFFELFVELLAVVLEFVEVLLLDPRLTETEPVTGAVVGATTVELDAGAVLCVVLAATVASALPAALGASPADVRSITPTLGVTRLGIASEAVDAASELPDPDSEPQAARPNVSRLHSTTLRMCERAAEGIFFIDHYPG
jgi:hypothetical protein